MYMNIHNMPWHRYRIEQWMVLSSVLSPGYYRPRGDWSTPVADPGFGGRGGVNCHKQGRSPCSRHEVASGGWVREGGGGCPPSPCGRKWKSGNA